LRRALSKLGLNENSACDDPCSDAVEIAADDALTVQYERALQALMNGTQLSALIVDITGVPRSVFAVESLLRLLGDDLGGTLFDAGTIAQLGARLCGPRSVRPGLDQVQHRHRNVRAEGAIAVSFRHHADNRRHADDHYDE
jgi:hypothetical protein